MCLYWGFSTSTLWPFWSSNVFAVGPDLCIAECLAASLASTHWFPVAYFPPHVIIKTISKHCQVFLGRKIITSWELMSAILALSVVHTWVKIFFCHVWGKSNFKSLSVPFKKKKCFILFYFVVAVVALLCSMGDLSSLTRDWSPDPCRGSGDS